MPKRGGIRMLLDRAPMLCQIREIIYQVVVCGAVSEEDEV